MAGREAATIQRPYNWKKVEKPRTSMRWFRYALLLLVLIVLAILGTGGYIYYKMHSPQGSGSSNIAFIVRPGDTDAIIANRLQQQGILHDPLVFRIDARLQGLGGSLRVGIHVLRRDMSIDQMVSALAAYKVTQISITIPEGWRAGQIALQLKNVDVSPSEFFYEVYHRHLSLGFPAGIPSSAHLEGFLSPNTYDVTPGTSGADFANRLVQQFAVTFTPSMRNQARRLGRSVYDIVTLASIVEREARVASERPIIASVYYNRLRQGMLLQADPTVQYAMGRPTDWWPLLTVSDYRSVRSPYNTYLHSGLPPSPIANPGIASVYAALHPAHTSYLYFVAKGNTGFHAFAKTYQEQLRNQKRYGH
jgi:UPF0755 protein